MSRRRNHNTPGEAHELTFSTYQRFPFLLADRVRVWLRDSIDLARVRHDFSVWAYVIMPEHVHLIVYSHRPDYDIAEIRKAIKEPVGRRAIWHLVESSPNWLAKVTRRRGAKTEQLFWLPGGGYDRNIDSPKTLRLMIEYIHNNPVRRGLVASPGDWLWSSAGFYELGVSPPIGIDAIPEDWAWL